MSTETQRKDPVEAIIKALRDYLRDRGHMLFSLASSESIARIALRGLWRRHDISTGYVKLMDAVREAKRSEEHMKRLREYGILGFEVFDGELYAVVDLRKLRELWRRASRPSTR